MDKRTINIIIGVVLGLGAILAINDHLRRQESRIKRLLEEGRAVEVVVARIDIPKESTLTINMVETRIVRSASLQPGDLSSLDSAIGKFAEVDILKGQHINSNMVRSLAVAKYLSQAVPQGMRAVTIPVDKISAIEGLIKPGDKIDIIGTFVVPVGGGRTEPIVITVFEGVRVLATNRNISQYRVSKAADTITVALKPEDVRDLIYILTWGKLTLSLRAPLDTAQEYEYRVANFETLTRKLGIYRLPAPERKSTIIDVFKGPEVEETPIN